MATDADNVIVGQNGHVYLAAVGTTAPVDTSTALSATWLAGDVGFISEDGVTFTPTLENYMVRAWQSQGRPVRRGVANRDEAFALTMLEWNPISLAAAFGGAVITELDPGPPAVYKLTPPSGADEDERAAVIEWEDGDEVYRLVIPKCTVTDLAEFNLQRTEAAGLNVTFGVVNDGTTDPFYILTENANWEPAA